ncbi:Unannotated [Lentimonas sp. CC19]|nr:Unannotated [Lentimonas sp. CC19]CAA6696317.1 Unannotated [Lentimonas sp. CC10]CAA7071269.1 Unannotated [Lentimonas sp. CC11]
MFNSASPLRLLNLMAIAMLITTGCSTTPQNEQSWETLLETNAPQATNGTTYDQSQVAQDLKQFELAQQELESLHSEITTLQRTLTFQDHPYLDDSSNKTIELILFRFINARDTLSNITRIYRSQRGINTTTQTKGNLLAMAAGLTSDYYSSYFCALFDGNKPLIEVLNTAHPRFAIPAGTYDRIYSDVTSLDNLQLLDAGWRLYSTELNDPTRPISQLINNDPQFAHLADQMDERCANTRIYTEYLLHSSQHTLSDLEDRLHHSEIEKIVEAAEQEITKDMYKTRGFVFKNVARIKDPETHLLEFSNKQADEIKQLLQPGDIILTYTAGYMSDVFLPGNFKHGITYIGTPEQRRAVGLTDQAIKQAAISEAQAQALIGHVQVDTMTGDYQVDIIEAVAEGVVMHSLDKLLETHINRLVVIRPKLTEAERLEQLIAVFQYVGTAYDFKFDFQNDSYQCCTEVVYRTINGKSSIDFSLVKMKGRWILAADDILRYYLAQNPEAFEFILLADQSNDSKDFNAVLHTGPAGLDTLYELMNLPEPTAKQ